MEKIDIYPVFVEPFHVDYTGRIFMGVLGNHMLNAAGQHSTRRGWGLGTLQEHHHTWVLSRLSIEMEEMPRQYENIEVHTWVESVMKLFTNRNFAIRGKDGKAYGYARSVWAMIDMETRRPLDLTTLYDGDICNYVVSEEENHCPIEGHGRFRFKDAEYLCDLHPAYSDIDINGHVNSIKYVEHILNLFPKEQFQDGIRRFEIAYKNEAYYGETLAVYRQRVSETETDIELRKQATGEVVCQAKIRFNTIINS